MLEEKFEALLKAEWDRALEYEAEGDDECYDDGLFESLLANTITEKETRYLAEDLEKSKELREQCALHFELGFYDGSPFELRMRRFRDNPDEETDEHWKRIAAAFDPTLEAILEPSGNVPSVNRWIADVQTTNSLRDFVASVVCAPVDGSRTNDTNIIVSFAGHGVEADANEASAPTTAETERKLGYGGGTEKTAKKWSVPWASVACAAFVAVATCSGLMFWRGTGTPAPEQIASDNRPSNANEYAASNADETQEGLLNALSGRSGGDETPATAASRGGGEKGGDEAFAFPSYEYMESHGGALENFDGLSEINGEAREAFLDGNFSLAAKRFGEAVERLEAEKSVDEQTMMRALWNWGVATAKSGDRETAVKIFERLKTRDLNASQGQFMSVENVDAALKAWRQ